MVDDAGVTDRTWDLPDLRFSCMDRVMRGAFSKRDDLMDELVGRSGDVTAIFYGRNRSCKHEQRSFWLEEDTWINMTPMHLLDTLRLLSDDKCISLLPETSAIWDDPSYLFPSF